MIIQKQFLIYEPKFEHELFGNFDENIKLIEKNLNTDILLREGTIVVLGEEKNVETTLELLGQLHRMVEVGKTLDRQAIVYAIDLLFGGSQDRIKELEDTIVITKKGNPVKPKTLGQKEYVNLIENHDITFGIGPAGTGKTYLAVAMAVKAFKSDEVTKIILTRPAVEAGETLGFLPGDMKDKVDPYLRPLYDALFDMFGPDKFNKFLERGIIEVAPLAFMRGRTLDNAFIILDEAQNTTPEQMKMFLTRLGFGSKAVVTGDITQTDLPRSRQSGLVQAIRILEGVKGIGYKELTEKDVVRHELVQRIIKAYAKHEKKLEFKEKSSERKRPRDDKSGDKNSDSRGKSVLHALSLCILDVRRFDGRSMAALVGLHADGGGIAFCDFRRHEDDVMIFPYFSSMEPAPSFGITALCRSEGDGKFLLFLGVFFDRPRCMERSSCNDVAVLSPRQYPCRREHPFEQRR